MKKQKQKINEFFRQKRIEANLTQKNIADHFELGSTQFVSNWERGLCLPPNNYLPDLCKLYKMSKNEVIQAIIGHREEELQALFVAKAKKLIS